MFGGRFLPSEHQALLEACVELGLEQVRQSGARYDHLFSNVKKIMEDHGIFPDRRPSDWKKFYLQAEENYRLGKLHPPVARTLWGKEEKDYTANDIRWNKLLQTTFIFEDKNSKNILRRRDTRYLIQEAIERNVEGTPKEEQLYLFEDICTKMHQRNVFVDKTSEQLFRYYHKMKQLYLRGFAKYLAPDASTLWMQPNVEKEPEPDQLPVYYEITTVKEELDSNDVQMHQTDDIQAAKNTIEEKTVCRICRSSMMEGAKHLLDSAFFGKTYKDLLEETINIEIRCEQNSNLNICTMCSTLIGNLSSFVRQCKESFKQLTEKNVPANEVRVKEEPKEMDESGTEDASFWTQELVSEVTIEETVIKQEIFDEPSFQVDVPQTSLQEVKERSNPHETRPLPTRRMKCEVCERVSKVRNALQDQIEPELEECIQCESCSRKYASVNQLKAHMNIHTRKSKWTCRFCHRIFYFWKAHKEHEQAHLDKINSALHSCFECGIVYSL